MGMDQYLLIPFLGGWTSINPSYFELQGYYRFWHTAISPISFEMILWNDSTLCIRCERFRHQHSTPWSQSKVLIWRLRWFTHPRNHQLCPLWTKTIFFGGEGCLTQLLYHLFGTQPTSSPGILGGASASVWPHHVVGANTQWTWAPKPHRVEGISRRPIWWGTYAPTSPTKLAILRHLSLWPSIFWGIWWIEPLPHAPKWSLQKRTRFKHGVDPLKLCVWFSFLLINPPS